MRECFNVWEKPSEYSKHDDMIWVENLESKRFSVSGRDYYDLKPSKDHYWITHLACDCVFYTGKAVSRTIYGVCSPEVFKNKIQNLSKEYKLEIDSLTENLMNFNEADVHDQFKDLFLLFKTSCLFKNGVTNITWKEYTLPNDFYNFQFRVINAMLVALDRLKEISKEPDNVTLLYDEILNCGNVHNLIFYLVRSRSVINNSPSADFLLKEVKFDSLGAESYPRILDVTLQRQRDPKVLQILLAKVDDPGKLIDYCFPLLCRVMTDQSKYKLIDLIPLFPSECFSAKSPMGDTPLHMAIGSNTCPSLKKSTPDPTFFNNILEAIPFFPSECFSAKNSKGDTPLHTAIISAWVPVIKLVPLLPSECFSVKDSNGDTPLHAVIGSRVRCLDLIASMAQRGGDEALNAVNRRGKTVLSIAIEDLDFSLLKGLVGAERFNDLYRKRRI